MKLKWSRDAVGRERHFRDAMTVFEMQRSLLDLPYMERWVVDLGLTGDWQRLLAEARPIE